MCDDNDIRSRGEDLIHTTAHTVITAVFLCGPAAFAANSNALLLQKLQVDEKKILEMYDDCLWQQNRMNAHRLRGPGEETEAVDIDLFQKKDLGCDGFLAVLKRNRQAQQSLINQR
jgi:hypothetical protein